MTATPAGMRLIHTSDWHLGKKYQKISLVPEQKLFLDWLFELISQRQIQVLLIAGDIFDTPIPTTEALQLYFSFLDRVQRQTQCHVIVLAGNHDSGKFLQAPSPLYERVTIIGQIDQQQDILIHHGEISLAIMGLPFFRMHEIEQVTPKNDQTIVGAERILENISYLCQQFIQRAQKQGATHRLIMAHHQFGQYSAAGSELSLTLSGLDSIPISIFPESIDALCLGHIHQAQTLNAQLPLAQYSGSPYPLRAGERGQKKISLIELNNNLEKRLDQQWIEVPAWRRFDRIQLSANNWHEVLLAYCHEVSKPDQLSAIVEIHLQCKVIDYKVIEAIYHCLEKFPIHLSSLRPIVEFAGKISNDLVPTENQEHQGPLELFRNFYREHQFGDELPANIVETFTELIHQASVRVAEENNLEQDQNQEQDISAEQIETKESNDNEDIHASH
jgi:exonuclease SbcD